MLPLALERMPHVGNGIAGHQIPFFGQLGEANRFLSDFRGRESDEGTSRGRFAMPDISRNVALPNSFEQVSTFGIRTKIGTHATCRNYTS